MFSVGKYLGLVIGAGALSVPFALVVTVVLFPFWSWIEDRFGVESVGHSGPAGWCFVVTYAVVFAGFLALWRALTKRRIPNVPPN